MRAVDATDEDALLQRARSGDTDALTTLLGRHAGDLHEVVRAGIPDRWRALVGAEDVLQETFTDAFVGIGAFEPCGEGALRAWLRTLARNNLRDALRCLQAEKRGGKAPASMLDALSSLSDLLLADSRASPSRHAARAEEVAALRAAIEALPPVHRAVVERYDLRGDSVEALAEDLGRSVGAVYLVRNRALRRLREAMLRFFATRP
jgi:RNA polymerase sigma-70 factor (ECF subfamily)